MPIVDTEPKRVLLEVDTDLVLVDFAVKALVSAGAVALEQGLETAADCFGEFGDGFFGLAGGLFLETELTGHPQSGPAELLGRVVGLIPLIRDASGRQDGLERVDRRARLNELSLGMLLLATDRVWCHFLLDLLDILLDIVAGCGMRVPLSQQVFIGFDPVLCGEYFLMLLVVS